MGVAVGIDLGTTNTVVAAVRNGKATTLADESGRRLIPSVVSFHPNETVLVGVAASERRIIDPENTIFSVKRMIGRSFKHEEVQKSRSRFPFELVEGPKEATLVATRRDTFALPEISAFVLRRAKAVAEAALGEEVDSAVITVPANFDDLQRASTKMAGKLAGLKVLRILNEPTAAALAYGRNSAETERIAIYDLGGGTFDITLLDLSAGVFEVLATAGDTALGGDDVDTLITDRIAEQALKMLRVDPRTNNVALAKIRIAAEALKCRLSSHEEATVEIDDVARGEGGVPLSLKFRLTRAELEQASQALLTRTMDVTQAAMSAAKLTVSAFDRVILVGGSTRMPLVARAVENLFKKKPDLRVNPDEVVALGAAIQAAALGTRSRAKPAPTADAAPPPVRKPQGGPAALARTMAGTSPAQTSLSVPPLSVSHAIVPLESTSAPKAQPKPELRATATAGAKPPRKERAAFVDPRREPDDDAPPHLPAPTQLAATPLAAPPASPVQSARAGEPEPGRGGEPGGGMVLPRSAPDFTWADDLEPPRAHGIEVAVVPEADIFARPAKAPAPVPATAPGDSLPPVFGTASLPPAEVSPVMAALDLPYGGGDGGAISSGEALLIDVTPLSLRVETVGGYSDVLIAANSPVPCDRTRVFTNASDNQVQVFIRVAQGEVGRFGENTFLGELELTGLTPQPRGEGQIAVTFEIDADGILNVRAKDNRTGRETTAQMHVVGGQTTPADFDAMRDRQTNLVLG